MKNDPFPESIFGRKTFTLPIGVALAVTALVIGAFTVFCYQTYVDFRAAIGFGATLFIASITIASILVTAENLRRGIQERKAVAAARFIERWNDPRLRDLKDAWRVIFKKLKNLEPDDAAKRLADDEEDRGTATEVFNYFEEMAVAINTGAADEDLLRRVFSTVILNYFYAAEPWIQRHRKMQGNFGYYIEIEQVIQRWKNPQ